MEDKKWYQIVVYQHGMHLFSTSNTSIPNKAHGRSLCEELMEKFPRSEGYKVDLLEIEETIKNVVLY
jgi:hypothetical protein